MAPISSNLHPIAKVWSTIRTLQFYLQFLTIKQPFELDCLHAAIFTLLHLNVSSAQFTDFPLCFSIRLILLSMAHEPSARRSQPSRNPSTWNVPREMPWFTEVFSLQRLLLWFPFLLNHSETSTEISGIASDWNSYSWEWNCPCVSSICRKTTVSVGGWCQWMQSCLPPGKTTAPGSFPSSTLSSH